MANVTGGLFCSWSSCSGTVITSLKTREGAAAAFGVFPSLSHNREKKAHARDAEERGTCSRQQDFLSRSELTGTELLFSRVDFNRMLDFASLSFDESR